MRLRIDDGRFTKTINKIIKPHGRHSGLDQESSDFFASANLQGCGKATPLDTGFRRYDRTTNKRDFANDCLSKISHCAIVSTCVFLLLNLFTPTLSAEEKWPGVDKAVVERFAKEHGREARPNLVNTDQGDLLLLVFLIAGTVGGFAAGYYWRVITERKTRERDKE